MTLKVSSRHVTPYAISSPVFQSSQALGAPRYIPLARGTHAIRVHNEHGKIIKRMWAELLVHRRSWWNGGYVHGVYKPGQTGIPAARWRNTESLYCDRMIGNFSRPVKANPGHRGCKMGQKSRHEKSERGDDEARRFTQARVGT